MKTNLFILLGSIAALSSASATTNLTIATGVDHDIAYPLGYAGGLIVANGLDANLSPSTLANNAYYNAGYWYPFFASPPFLLPPWSSNNGYMANDPALEIRADNITFTEPLGISTFNGHLFFHANNDLTLATGGITTEGDQYSALILKAGGTVDTTGGTITLTHSSPIGLNRSNLWIQAGGDVRTGAIGASDSFPPGNPGDGGWVWVVSGTAISISSLKTNSFQLGPGPAFNLLQAPFVSVGQFTSSQGVRVNSRDVTIHDLTGSVDIRPYETGTPVTVTIIGNIKPEATHRSYFDLATAVSLPSLRQARARSIHPLHPSANFLR